MQQFERQNKTEQNVVIEWKKREKRSQKSLKNETENKEVRFVHMSSVCILSPLTQKISNKNILFPVTIIFLRLQHISVCNTTEIVFETIYKFETIVNCFWNNEQI
jgi:hypothetical protein